MIFPSLDRFETGTPHDLNGKSHGFRFRFARGNHSNPTIAWIFFLISFWSLHGSVFLIIMDHRFIVCEKKHAIPMILIFPPYQPFFRWLRISPGETSCRHRWSRWPRVFRPVGHRLPPLRADRAADHHTAIGQLRQPWLKIAEKMPWINVI